MPDITLKQISSKEDISQYPHVAFFGNTKVNGLRYLDAIIKDKASEYGLAVHMYGKDICFYKSQLAHYGSCSTYASHFTPKEGHDYDFFYEGESDGKLTILFKEYVRQ